MHQSWRGRAYDGNTSGFFDLPKDKIIWDVGHQSYTHKILTGRKDGFDDLRKYGGMSGFPKEKGKCMRCI